MSECKDLVNKLRETEKMLKVAQFDEAGALISNSANAIDKLVNDREVLKRLVKKRKAVGKVPWVSGSSESRNAVIELHRIDGLIVKRVISMFEDVEDD